MKALAIAAIALTLAGCTPDDSPPPYRSAAGATVAPPSAFPTGCTPAVIGLEDSDYAVQRLVCDDGHLEVFVFTTQEDRDTWWTIVEKKYGHYKTAQGYNWIQVLP